MNGIDRSQKSASLSFGSRAALSLLSFLITQVASAQGQPPTQTTAKQSQAPSAAAAAANTVSTSVAPIPTSPVGAQNTQRFSLLLDASMASSLQREGDVSRVSENDFIFKPRWNINDRFALSALAIVSQETSGEQNTTFSNMKLLLSYKPLSLNEHIDFVPTVFSRLPTDTVSNKNDGFEGSGGLDTRFLFNSKWPWAASAFYSLTGEENVHTYTLNADGDANIQYLISNTVGATLPIWKTVAATVSGSYVSAWTYHAFVHNRFDLSETLAWDVTRAWSVYVGHSNKGSAVKANGRDSNVELFNQNVSVFSAGMSYIF